MSEENSTLKPKRGQLVILQFQIEDCSIQPLICLGWIKSSVPSVLLRKIQGPELVERDELYLENWENPPKDRIYTCTTIPMPEPAIEA